MVGIGLLEVLVLLCLVGLLAVLVAARLARRTARVTDRAQPLIGPTVVHQFFAGCGLVAMLPLALLALGLGLPAWQKLEATGRIGVTQYLMLGFGAALYTGLFVWLAQVFRGPRPVPPPSPVPQ